MDARIRVLQGILPDPERIVRIERVDEDRCCVTLVDYFISASGKPFLRVELEYTALLQTFGGSCTAIQTENACFAFCPMGSEMKISFQAADWPCPADWSLPQDEFNSAVLALL